MRYPKKKRKEAFGQKTRIRELLEWIAPDGTIYRSPQKTEEKPGASMILNRQRWAALGTSAEEIEAEMKAEAKE